MKLTGPLAHELRTCFTGRWFFISLALGGSIAIASAMEAQLAVNRIIDGTVSLGGAWGVGQDIYMGYSNVGSFANWMVCNANATLSATIFFYLLPLLASLPFAWSYCSDRITGYDAQLYSRAVRVRVFGAKGLATFFSGMVVATIPLLLNFAVLSCLLPAYAPRFEDYTVVGIFADSLFAWLFYNVPPCYVLAFTLLDGVLAGLWALFVLALSSLSVNRIAIMVVPYLGLLILQYVNTSLPAELATFLPSVNIIDDMQGTSFTTVTDPTFVLAQVIVMALCSFVLLWRASKRDVL